LIERLFPKQRSRQRLLDGPMGPYIEPFIAQLADLGYADGYVRNLVRLANSLGEWLEDHGMSPVEAGKPEIDAYIAAQTRSARGRLPDRMRGIRRLPALVAPLGILCRPEPPSFVDPVLERFGAYLGHVLGVTPNTSKSYGRYVRPFVDGICADAPPDWTRMDAAYVATFVLKHAGRPNATRSRIVSAVRTFLRFLVCERAVPASLVRAIPRIRQPWNAGVPRHLSAEELERVLEACQAKKNGSIRDRAFIALLARLGVRGRTARSASGRR
jgi:integrase/recombinase XerD